MTSTVHDVWADPDLTDLARTDPGLVAIADALAGAAASSRHRPHFPRPLHAAVAVAVTILAVAAPTLAFSQSVRGFLGLGSHPVVAQNWVKATLTSQVPLHAQAGAIVHISWTLWAPDQHGKRKPFDGEGIFARLVNPSATAANTAIATGHSGHYSASVRVPSGGIGKVQVGIEGWSSGPNGRHPAPVLFPLTNNPFAGKP